MNMIAKFRVTNVIPFTPVDSSTGNTGETQSVELHFFAVTTKPFDAEGASEDNSFSKWTPSGSLTMTVTNPALFETFAPGQTYYLNFTRADG